MGNKLSGKKKECRSLWIGLDGSGKTTAFYKLKLGEMVTTIPTIGFGVQTMEFQNISFTVWDVNGGPLVRPLWKNYYQNTQILLYFIDSSDKARIDESAKEFEKAVSGIEEKSDDIFILIFGNKNDLSNAMGIEEIADKLKVNRLRQSYFMVSCCALTGDGLDEPLKWVVSKLNKTKYEFDQETVGKNWLCSEYIKYDINKRKSILLISGWIRGLNNEYKLPIMMNVTQSICQFYIDLDTVYKFRYYGQ